ncbi:MAG: zinc ribbon domain-containing protein [Verrucomicrobiia bacterium]
MKNKRKPPEICPNCGAYVPEDALACPECGSDYETGWSERAYSQRLDLPDDEFDYDEFVREEFGGTKNRRFRKYGAFWIIVAIIIAILILNWHLGFIKW